MLNIEQVEALKIGEEIREEISNGFAVIARRPDTKTGKPTYVSYARTVNGRGGITAFSAKQAVAKYKWIVKTIGGGK